MLTSPSKHGKGLQSWALDEHAAVQIAINASRRVTRRDHCGPIESSSLARVLQPVVERSFACAHAAMIGHDAAELRVHAWRIRMLTQTLRIAFIQESCRFRPLSATGAVPSLRTHQHAPVVNARAVCHLAR